MASGEAPSERQIRKRLLEHAFHLTTIDYRYDAENSHVEYRLMVSSRRTSDVQRLSEAVRQAPAVQRFSISTIGD